MRFQRRRYRLLASVVVVSLAGLTLGSPAIGADDEVEDLGRAIPGDSGSALRLDESHLVEEYLVLDLCDDVSVVDSGLAAEVELEETRLGLGIMCDRGDSKYLVESLVGGESFLLDEAPSSEFISELRQRDLSLLAANPRWIGAWSATRSNRVDSVLKSPASREDGIAVLASSLSIDDGGTVRGLVANLSDSRSFDRARVSIDTGTTVASSDPMKMIIQPGETLPFEVKTKLREIPAVGDFTVRASRAQRQDRVRRSVMVSPMAMYHQDLGFVPERYVRVAVDPSTKSAVEVIELTVSLREPHTRQRVTRLKGPVAVVAAMNADGQVVEVHEVGVLDGSGEDGGNLLEKLEPGRDGRIGIVVGSDVVSVSAWVSGSNGGK